MERESIPIETLPTLTQLYESEKLDASIAQKSELEPSKRLNDLVHLVPMDITRIKCDAIVNAANKSLLGGGGVDGVIHNVAGRGLLAECRTLNGCQTGDAKITGGYNLPSAHVIHTVGPVYFHCLDSGINPSTLLGDCYRRSLEVAAENGCKSVAFPCISTGIYGYPHEKAARVAALAVRKFLEEQEAEKGRGGEVKEGEEEDAAVEGEATAGGKADEEVVEKSTEDKSTEEVLSKDVSATIDKAPEDKLSEDAAGEGPAETATEATAEEQPKKEKTFIEHVCFCIFMPVDGRAYDEIIPSIFPPVDPSFGTLDKLNKRVDDEIAASETATGSTVEDAIVIDDSPTATPSKADSEAPPPYEATREKGEERSAAGEGSGN